MTDDLAESWRGVYAQMGVVTPDSWGAWRGRAARARGNGGGRDE